MKSGKRQTQHELSPRLQAIIRAALVTRGWEIDEVDTLIRSRVLEEPAMGARLDAELVAAFGEAVDWAKTRYSI